MTIVARDGDVAGDVVAEAFSRAYERWDRLWASANPTGWVYRVAVNQLRRRLRRQALEARLLRRTFLSHTVFPDEVEPELWTAVAALPPRQREAIALRYIGDLPEREVAVAMGVALGTASATLTQARRSLAELLTEPEEARSI